jgi:starch synthase
VRTLLTIHNIAFQGVFWSLDMPVLNLPWTLFNYRQLEFHGKINFLKAGIVFADLITAVSPTYAREIQTATYGAGLQGVLTERRRDLFGIVNGVDYRTWSPAADRFIAANYDVDSVERGKPICKRDLQQRLNLPLHDRTPIIGMISRLAAQKGLDLVEKTAPKFLDEDVQLVVLGEGDPHFKRMLGHLHERYPDKVAVRFSLDEPLAHQIEAGADMFLMPSLFEPCGLGQLIAMRYGSVPVVRATGGLADTVRPGVTGFSFEHFSAESFWLALRHALHVYRTDPGAWRALQRHGMAGDFSWPTSARAYQQLYEWAIARVRGW